MHESKNDTGDAVGVNDGDLVGSFIGDEVGMCVGDGVGEGEGDPVGCPVIIVVDHEHVIFQNSKQGDVEIVIEDMESQLVLVTADIHSDLIAPAATV